MRNFLRWWAMLILLALLPAVGCGGKKLVTTSGVVTLNGQPLEGAVVQFQPTGSVGETATGVSQTDGSFQLKTGTAKGVVPGTYHVVVTRRSAQAKNKLESKLSDKATTADGQPLTVTVPHDGPVRVELSRAADSSPPGFPGKGR